jgi:anthranilate synthase component 2
MIQTMKVAVVDNYDSFTYNLVQILRESGLCGFRVMKNDRIDPENILRYDKVLISPGPGLPHQAGRLLEIIALAAPQMPVLGICLGHQAIACSRGGTLKQLDSILHGETSDVFISDPDEALFKSLPSKIRAGRYHSWIVDPDTLPDDLVITATGPKKEIMALRHKKWDLRGIQFHPESYMTLHGPAIIHNWLRL